MRCLRGENSAWEALYRQFHGGLLASIKSLAGSRRHDAEFIDEIAARVWYAVVRDDAAALARFDPHRGCRLGAYLATIARGEVGNYFRSERRRQNRERATAAAGGHGALEELAARSQISEFLALLTPRENEYCRQVLLAKDDSQHGGFSDANSWQLRSRIRCKLLSFLDLSDGDEPSR